MQSGLYLQDKNPAYLSEAFKEHCLAPSESTAKFYQREEDDKDDQNTNYENDPRMDNVRFVTYAKHSTWTLRSFLAYCTPWGWLFGTTKNVPEGSIGLIMSRGKPKIVRKGYHTLLDPWSTWVGEAKMSDLDITHGTLRVITVPQGQFVCIQDTTTGKYYFLTQGKHTLNSPTVRVEKRIENLHSQLIEVGAFRFANIAPGNVGVGFNQGKTVILQPGIHELPATMHYLGTLSTKDGMLDPPAGDQHKVKTETNDPMGVTVELDIFYRIDNAKSVVENIGFNNVVKQVKEKALSGIASMIRTLSFAEIGLAHDYALYKQGWASFAETLTPPPSNDMSTGLSGSCSSESAEVKTNSDVPPPPSAPSYQISVHDFVMQRLNEEYFKPRGLTLTQISLKSVIPAPDANQRLGEIAQVKARAKVSEETAASTARTNLLIANSAKDVALVAADTKAAETIKQAEAEAKKIHILALADAQRQETLATAELKAAQVLERSQTAVKLRQLSMVTSQLPKTTAFVTSNLSPHQLLNVFAGNGLSRSSSEPNLLASSASANSLRRTN